MVVEKLTGALAEWKPDLPQILVMGQGGTSGTTDGILASVLAQLNQAVPAAKPAAASAGK
jgi:hypothetical protein